MARVRSINGRGTDVNNNNKREKNENLSLHLSALEQRKIFFLRQRRVRYIVFFLLLFENIFITWPEGFRYTSLFGGERGYKE